MPYWMTSPAHGVMPVYSLSEVEQAKAHGWALLNEGNSPQRVTPEVAAKAIEHVILNAGPQNMGSALAGLLPAKRKPGRPAKVK